MPHVRGLPANIIGFGFIPDAVGVREPQLAVGAGTGRKAALAARLAGLGYSLVDAALDGVFHRFADLADRNRIVSDADLVALATDGVRQSVATSEGKGTLGEATAETRSDLEALGHDRPFGHTRTRVVGGQGSSIDVAEASAQAYVSTPGVLVDTAKKRRGTDEPTLLNRDILMNGVDTGAPPEGAALWDASRELEAGRTEPALDR